MRVLMEYRGIFSFDTKPYDLNNQDVLSNKSFIENIQNAQKNQLPYYLIAAVSTEEPDSFEFFDGVRFFQLTIDQAGSTTQKVYYCAYSLFQFDSNHICTPISIAPGELKFQSLDTSHLSKEQIELLIKGTNSHVSKLNDKEFKEMRSIQRDISQLIQSKEETQKINLNIFNDDERRQEALKWLWCAASNNNEYQAQLAKECILSTPQYTEAANKIYLKLNQIPKEQLSDRTKEILDFVNAALKRQNRFQKK